VLLTCALPSVAANEAPRPGDSATHAIYVVRRGLHTGIAIPAARWPDRKWPVRAEFPDARYLEFGWGDAAYYQAETKTSGMTVAAVFWPTSSVVEVLGLTDVSLQLSSGYEAVELHVSEQQLDALVASIGESFSGTGVTPTGTVLTAPQGRSRFYFARGKFHFFRMCNWWTARRLEAIGCPIGHVPVVTPTRALHEARRCERK
jgi:uncharacterized protein (TIGR02117 family)